MDEILGIFFEEVTGSIDELEKMFLELRIGAESAAFKALFRVAHNIKGSSKSVGMANMGRVTHELETLLIKLGDGQVELSQEMLGVLLSSVDALKALVDQAQATGQDGLEISDIVAEIKTIQEQAMAAKLAKDMGSAQDGDIIFMEQPNEIGSSTEVPPLQDHLPSREIVQATSQVAAPKAAGQSAAQRAASETVRVPTHRIDRLQNHVGEILVLQSVLSEQLREHTLPLVRNALRQMRKVTREVQEDSMGLRLVSIKNLFLKLTRAVHDAANALGKQVEFVTSGEDTEVDKVLSEGLADPLMHMVRNAVDHGQENPDEREKLGKQRKGRIELTARSEGGFLVVRLTDDGKGLDTDVILEKARTKGLVGPRQDLTQKQIFSLIFQPGFSTKAVVTEVSGRGVGMDVVQTNIHAMRGHIEIDSTMGKGTVFSLHIPLAIALLDGMILQLGDEKWIMPLHMVVESFRHASCDISPVVGVGDVLSLRGENIPVVDLGKALQVPRREKPCDPVVIVVRDKDVRIALIADGVLGIQTVVSKPLGPEMHAREGIAGCAILGDGKTSLILEISTLHKSLGRGGDSAARRIA
jgi:two-component system chemotaxis sensor kinase CheA